MVRNKSMWEDHVRPVHKIMKETDSLINHNVYIILAEVQLEFNGFYILLRYLHLGVCHLHMHIISPLKKNIRVNNNVHSSYMDV